MSSTSEQLAQQKSEIAGLRNKVTGLSANPMIYAATGETVFFGCKVTEGASSTDMTVALEGNAAGDTDRLNPDIAVPPVYEFEYPNIASLKSGAFYTTDLETTVDAPPSAGLGRYDIAYIYLGPTGPGFAIATGTPGAGTKTDFDDNGLVTTPYDSGSDPALPVGAVAVARIYVEDVYTGIQNALIADIRNFSGRLKGDAFTWGDMSPTQKGELIDPAVAAATAAVLVNNEAFKKQLRTQHWLGI